METIRESILTTDSDLDPQYILHKYKKQKKSRKFQSPNYEFRNQPYNNVEFSVPVNLNDQNSVSDENEDEFKLPFLNDINSRKASIQNNQQHRYNIQILGFDFIDLMSPFSINSFNSHQPYLNQKFKPDHDFTSSVLETIKESKSTKTIPNAIKEKPRFDIHLRQQLSKQKFGQKSKSLSRKPSFSLRKYIPSEDRFLKLKKLRQQYNSRNNLAASLPTVPTEQNTSVRLSSKYYLPQIPHTNRG